MSSSHELPEELQFKVLSPDTSLTDGPRLGRLIVPDRSPIHTPDFFAITSRGVIPHITPDVLQEHLKIQGAHFALEDFVERSNPPITQCPTSKVPPLHTFTALPSQKLTILAARRTPAVSSPTGNSDISISTFTSTGFQTLTSKQYTTYIQTLRPDIAISLADIPTSGTAKSTKRLGKMTDRTTVWLKELIASSHNSETTSSAIFAPILPLDAGDQFEYLEYLADELSGSFQGLAFHSANLIPAIPPTTTLTKLPRLSLEVASSPHQILRQISLGIDLMIIPFINACSEAGIALDFQFPAPPPDVSGSGNGNEGTSKDVLPLGTNLWSKEDGRPTSTLPISPDCTCYTCTHHTIAYIHHLLSAREMLAWTLLQIHNHHILSQFFASIRASISAGGDDSGRHGFDNACGGFARRYESTFPEKTGTGPRARGYHFRGEGPGQGRRNERSWGGLFLLGEDGRGGVLTK